MAAVLIAGNTLGQLSAHRSVIVFGSETNQLLANEQLSLLEKAAKGVKERDIKVIILEKGSPLCRTNRLLQIEQLFSIIDAMPMRQSEMRERKTR